MANPFAVVPYHDPFDDQLRNLEHFLMSDDDESPTLPLTDINLPQYSNNNSSSFNNPSFILQSSDADDDEIVDTNDPLSDPFVWDLFDFNNQRDEENDKCRKLDSINVHNSIIDENTLQLSVWPVPNPPYPCNSCQVLREITHTNGIDVTKLEIHGRLGMICHAILEKYRIDFSTNQNHDYHMFDFCEESMRSVKQFLEQYCEERKRSGYIMLQDPLSVFYEALCVGLDWEDSVDTDDLIQPSPFDSVMDQSEAESCGKRLTRSSLAAQRERTGKLTLKDFIKYFHIPIETAARKVHVCPTVIKKICRKHGLSRWPHRKIKAIERRISRKAKGLTSVDAEERACAQADIERLQQEIANIYSRFDG